MKAKGILFNTEAVRAILDGRKTMTRLVVKLKYEEVVEIDRSDSSKFSVYASVLRQGELAGKWIRKPYQIGDILYVRETWATWFEMRKSGQAGHLEQFYYKADSDLSSVKWRPSIHMPHEAARIFLRVTDVRVERLQDITEADCINDGDFCTEAVRAVGKDALFKALWDSTIKKANLPRYGWDANPWCWVVSFERIRKEELQNGED